jgi:hypothetical protein
MIYSDGPFTPFEGNQKKFWKILPSMKYDAFHINNSVV